MRTWGQIDANTKEAILLHLLVATPPHAAMADEALRCVTVGPLMDSFRRQTAMVDAIRIAMQFLASKEAIPNEWDLVELIRQEFIIGYLLDLHFAMNKTKEHNLKFGLLLAAQRCDHVAEAAYAAAIALGWVDMQGLAKQWPRSILERMGEAIVHVVMAATWINRDKK